MEPSRLYGFNNQEFTLPLRSLCSLDVDKIYKVTSMKFHATRKDRKMIAEINKTFAVILPNRTFEFLDIHLNLYDRMVERTRDYHLGLRLLNKKSDRIEFREL